jgi:urease beta subunit
VGGIADQQQPEFRQYVTTQSVPSYSYREEVRVGATLPESGVTLYEVPAQYKVKGYRYTVVNNTPVLVEPGTRRIVQVIR